MAEHAFDTLMAALDSPLIVVTPTVSSGVRNRSICVGLMIGFVGVVALLGIDFIARPRS